MTKFKKDDRVHYYKDAACGGTVTAVWAVTVEVDWDDGTHTRMDSNDLRHVLSDEIRAHAQRLQDSGMSWDQALADAKRTHEEQEALALLREKLQGGRSLRERIAEKVAPSWDDVRVGDKITVTFRGETLTATVYLDGKWKHFLGYSTGSTSMRTQFTLVSIERPKPPLPTEPGSVIRLMDTCFAHRRKSDGRWVTDAGIALSDDQIQRQGWKAAS